MTRAMAMTVLIAAFARSPAAASMRYGAACGIERWPVKVLADRGARSLPATPVSTTIARLASLRAPADPDAVADRVRGMETTLWRIRARLVGYRIERDGDYHLVLSDPGSGQTMIGEIPAPYCTSSREAAEFAAARRAVNAIGRHTATRRWWWLDYRGATPPTVVVTGYGFFDRITDHHARGAARNGAELHPVLRIAATAAAF